MVGERARGHEDDPEGANAMHVHAHYVVHKRIEKSLYMSPANLANSSQFCQIWWTTDRGRRTSTNPARLH